MFWCSWCGAGFVPSGRDLRREYFAQLGEADYAEIATFDAVELQDWMEALCDSGDPDRTMDIRIRNGAFAQFDLPSDAAPRSVFFTATALECIVNRCAFVVTSAESNGALGELRDDAISPLKAGIFPEAGSTSFSLTARAMSQSEFNDVF